MSFKDITNKELAFLQSCEHEPIHIPGSIQSHGFLLGLQEDVYTIKYCSENLQEFVNLSYTNVLGKSFTDIFGKDNAENLQEYIANDFMLSATVLKIEVDNKEFSCTVHKSDTTYILEAELKKVLEVSNDAKYNETVQFLSYMKETNTLQELCSLVAKGTRKATGYDRVMIYRFDKNNNGEVIAEDAREDLEPYLGLHYPHTDIPVQARKLYIKNLLRIIADTDSKPVPIYALEEDKDNKDLNLSMSILRSVSPIHIQYLKNMGVQASMSISLIHNKKLWGLIACHHYSPKALTPEDRLTAQLQGHFITSQIGLRQSYEEYEITRKVKLALDNISAVNLTSHESFAELAKHSDLLRLCNATGVAIVYDGGVYKSEATPSEDEIQYMANWLAAYTNNSTFATTKITQILSEYENICDVASGLVYHSLNTNNNNCIIWLREETQKSVNWAGDPGKDIEKDIKGLSPRKSFVSWKEIVKCTSTPWLAPEIEATKTYVYNLQKQINILIITEEEKKQRKLSELLQETNAELENINWISTHDLQEPLRKIQLISSRLLVKEDNISENVQNAVQRMSNSAYRMQTLILDILKYTRIRHTEASFEKLDLNRLMHDVKSYLEESIDEANGTISIDELPPVEGITFLLKQLFCNIISNSIKYVSPDRDPEIKITASEEPVTLHNNHDERDSKLYNVIYITDNGIGFEQQFSESIFNIFTRLHNMNEYKGSGVGLALCKKIMQNHKGYIKASSKPGEGTTICVYFPYN